VSSARTVAAAANTRRSGRIIFGKVGVALAPGAPESDGQFPSYSAVCGKSRKFYLRQGILG
jgi:hypothetical protein